MTPIEIVVHGTPAPQGSKKGYVRGGRAVLVESSAKVKPWREAVKQSALLADYNYAENVGAIGVAVVFYMPRPKSHYGTGANAHMLRDRAPRLPIGKPDLDKLLRSTLDALTDAGIWRDDSQVVVIKASKVYADFRPPGAVIVVGDAL